MCSSAVANRAALPAKPAVFTANSTTPQSLWSAGPTGPRCPQSPPCSPPTLQHPSLYGQRGQRGRAARKARRVHRQLYNTPVSMVSGANRAALPAKPAVFTANSTIPQSLWSAGLTGPRCPQSPPCSPTTLQHLSLYGQRGRAARKARCVDRQLYNTCLYGQLLTMYQRWRKQSTVTTKQRITDPECILE